jgi:hypothetical protein
MKKLVILTVLAMMVFAPQAYADMSIGANVETNTTFSGASNGSDTTTYTNDGRVEVVIEAKTENDDGMFAAGKGCFEVKVDGGLGECDVWFQIGNPSFSLKVGHFENEGLFSKGQDIYVAGTGAADWYEVNKARGRAPDGMGVVFNLGENMTLDTKLSYDNDGSMNQLGVRPVLILSAGALNIKAGGEYLMMSPFDSDSDDEETWFGAGVDVSIAMGNITIGGSGTYGKNEVTTVTVDDTTGESMTVDAEETYMSDTVYLKLAMGDSTLGLGAGYTMEDESEANEMYAYVSYDMPLPVEGAAVKFGASFASGDDGADGEPTAYGARVRFFYGF